MTRVVRCAVEYDGTAFAGFQRQPDQKTVQGVLELAIQSVTRESVVVVGAGRTDAGVHAIGQVVHFKTESDLSMSTLQRAINANLPLAVRIRELQEAGPAFHARFSARSREYRYIVENASVPSPLLRMRAFHVPGTVDVEAMDEAARTLRGRHDFVAFGAPMVHTARNADSCEEAEVKGGTERTMLDARCWRCARFVYFRFVADAFLRHMVRMLIGTLLRIGSGSLIKQALALILQGDRSVFAGPAVPAHGLYLVRVRY
jgi:tRNA pseudouridine38-40 synthase